MEDDTAFADMMWKNGGVGLLQLESAGKDSQSWITSRIDGCVYAYPEPKTNSLRIIKRSVHLGANFSRWSLPVLQ